MCCGSYRNQTGRTPVTEVVRIKGRRWPTALAVAVLVLSCARQPATIPPGSSETEPERITQIPLLGSGYVYDVAVGEGVVWVTSHAGLYRIDPAAGAAVNVLPQDYLFRVALGHGAVWISTGSDGRVLRVDPYSNTVTAEIDVGAGPVTSLAVSEDAVWASAESDLVRIDPATNEVVARLRSQRGFGEVAFGEGALWVIAGANKEGDVLRIDPATTEVQQRIPLANPSGWNEIAAGEGAVWVTSSPNVHSDGASLVGLYRIDPSTGDITAEKPLGSGPSGLVAGEGASSYSALALGEGSVWVKVDYEGILVRIDPSNLSVMENLEGIASGSSDVPPGLTIGAGAVWVAAPEAITHISLEG
jgi:streptogramin lyase